jgi:hypothetical protein
MYQAVTIFASNFDPIRAEEFYKDVTHHHNSVPDTRRPPGPAEKQETFSQLLSTMKSYICLGANCWTKKGF